MMINGADLSGTPARHEELQARRQAGIARRTAIFVFRAGTDQRWGGSPAVSCENEEKLSDGHAPVFRDGEAFFRNVAIATQAVSEYSSGKTKAIVLARPPQRPDPLQNAFFRFFLEIFS